MEIYGTIIKTNLNRELVIIKEVLGKGTTKFLCTTPGQFSLGVNMYTEIVTYDHIEVWDYKKR